MIKNVDVIAGAARPASETSFDFSLKLDLAGTGRLILITIGASTVSDMSSVTCGAVVNSTFYPFTPLITHHSTVGIGLYSYTFYATESFLKSHNLNYFVDLRVTKPSTSKGARIDGVSYSGVSETPPVVITTFSDVESPTGVDIPSPPAASPPSQVGDFQLWIISGANRGTTQNMNAFANPPTRLVDAGGSHGENDIYNLYYRRTIEIAEPAETTTWRYTTACPNYVCSAVIFKPIDLPEDSATLISEINEIPYIGLLSINGLSPTNLKAIVGGASFHQDTGLGASNPADTKVFNSFDSTDEISRIRKIDATTNPEPAATSFISESTASTSTAADVNRRSSSAPSPGIGPDSAYNGGFYVYCETSSPTSLGDYFYLRFEDILDASTPGGLKVEYHYMQRAGINPEMQWQYLPEGADGTTGWIDCKLHVGPTVAQDDPAVWSKGFFNLKYDFGFNSGNVQLRVRWKVSTTGTAWHNDQAIDNVIFTSRA
ncbi:hypothetical protein [Kiloniella sp.]|uniref:hypothetical protein n=1 Tax=Kiloniella sp. TaxID=1938587 RepID=UPI003B023506